MASRGALIVVEGIDRSGKSTLCTSLVAALVEEEGLEVVHQRFPDRTTAVGQVIDRYLSKEIFLPAESIHLLMSANRWERQPYIEAKLEHGATVVCDRYCYSGVAYSLAKQVEVMDDMWCETPDSGLPKPDLVLFLDLTPEAAAARSAFGDEIYEESDFQKRVRSSYQHLREADAKDPDERTWTVLDADQPPDDLCLEALSHAKRAVAACKAGRPLEHIWLVE